MLIGVDFIGVDPCPTNLIDLLEQSQLISVQSRGCVPCNHQSSYTTADYGNSDFATRHVIYGKCLESYGCVPRLFDRLKYSADFLHLTKHGFHIDIADTMK